ncbi:hypothetical protein WR25_25749 [Diploscapter pachys]|uniref:C2H2-type domain-containing protein n=1 Tax=Diploscapter pachys TaxID=2018661 RepID=A0A2A2JDU1_9BILA|nr:hypothetical protein WR25_25749 [Diploscapter pachys]
MSEDGESSSNGECDTGTSATVLIGEVGREVYFSVNGTIKLEEEDSPIKTEGSSSGMEQSGVIGLNRDVPCDGSDLPSSSVVKTEDVECLSDNNHSSQEVISEGTLVDILMGEMPQSSSSRPASMVNYFRQLLDSEEVPEDDEDVVDDIILNDRIKKEEGDDQFDNEEHIIETFNISTAQNEDDHPEHQPNLVRNRIRKKCRMCGVETTKVNLHVFMHLFKIHRMSRLVCSVDGCLFDHYEKRKMTQHMKELHEGEGQIREAASTSPVFRAKFKHLFKMCWGVPNSSIQNGDLKKQSSGEILSLRDKTVFCHACNMYVFGGTPEYKQMHVGFHMMHDLNMPRYSCKQCDYSHCQTRYITRHAQENHQLRDGEEAFYDNINSWDIDSLRSTSVRLFGHSNAALLCMPLSWKLYHRQFDLIDTQNAAEKAVLDRFRAISMKAKLGILKKTSSLEKSLKQSTSSSSSFPSTSSASAPVPTAKVPPPTIGKETIPLIAYSTYARDAPPKRGKRPAIQHFRAKCGICKRFISPDNSNEFMEHFSQHLFEFHQIGLLQCTLCDFQAVNSNLAKMHGHFSHQTEGCFKENVENWPLAKIRDVSLRCYGDEDFAFSMIPYKYKHIQFQEPQESIQTSVSACSLLDGAMKRAGVAATSGELHSLNTIFRRSKRKDPGGNLMPPRKKQRDRADREEDLELFKLLHGMGKTG